MASKEEATSEEYPQCESSGGSCDSGASPAAIQAIATGNVFSPALSAAIAASGGLKQLEGLRRRVVCDGHFLGEELSPLFCAIQAILKDTLPLQAIGNKGRWKRVVVFLPGVSGTGSSTLTYQRALQRFLYPWRLYFLAADRWLRPTAAAVIDSLSWLETGGVMLLSPEDPLSWLSYLREEAEVVIDCGAASSSKSVCRNKVVHIRLTSEIEIASDLTHPFSTWRPVRELQQHTMEEGFLGRVLAYARVSGTVTYCLRSAAALVEWFNDEHDQEGNVGPHLQQLARLLLACCCRAREGD
ncbi:unnamed protein product [Trypanosoma congolense IL3000]|uniref:WGS project CAEQ00000000 data, annotated contig 1569 n=1 Tax=Trypanosoma congolense (strain IL3000) TaxID=1068625 RepID=F9W749_TRYCI|nr:unnamed protein product [Trypanosoma congolense IL3000]